MWQPLGAPLPSPIPSEAFFPDEESANAKPEKSTSKTGLVAEYFDANFARKLKIDRVDKAEAIWSLGSPAWDLPGDAGCRYTGVLVPPVTGQYKLMGWADNRMAVWIDGKPILDADQTRRKVESAFVDLEANKPYPIRIDFVDSVSYGGYFLHWTPPKGTKELSIPPECLFQTKAAVPKKR